MTYVIGGTLEPLAEQRLVRCRLESNLKFREGQLCQMQQGMGMQQQHPPYMYGSQT